MRELMLILHMLGLSLGVGVSFAHFFLGISRSKMDKSDAKQDAIRSLSLGMMADIGLTLLIGSGLFLMKPYWATLFDSHLLMTKLSFVIILVVLLVIIRINGTKAIKNPEGRSLHRIKVIGKFTLLISIAIIILAVFNFH